MLKKFFILIILTFILTGCSEEEPILTVNTEGKETVIDAETIYTNQEAITFPAVVRSSGEKPVETEYKGIELSKLLKSLDIDIFNYSKATFNASDGYRIILSVEEINDPLNVYLSFERDGQLLKSKKQGGKGPFQLIIRRDPFSQRWIKHVDEIIIQ